MSNGTIDAATLLSISRNRNKLLKLAEGIKPRKKSSCKRSLDLRHDPAYTNIEHLVFGTYRPRSGTPDSRGTPPRCECARHASPPPPPAVNCSDRPQGGAGRPESSLTDHLPPPSAALPPAPPAADNGIASGDDALSGSPPESRSNVGREMTPPPSPPTVVVNGVHHIVARIPTLDGRPQSLTPPISSSNVKSRKSSPSSSPRSQRANHSGIPKPKVYYGGSTAPPTRHGRNSSTPSSHPHSPQNNSSHVPQRSDASGRIKRLSPSNNRKAAKPQKAELKTPVIKPPNVQGPANRPLPPTPHGSRLNGAKSVLALNSNGSLKEESKPSRSKSSESSQRDRMTCRITIIPPNAAGTVNEAPKFYQVGRYSMRAPSSSSNPNFVPGRSRASFSAARSAATPLHHPLPPPPPKGFSNHSNAPLTRSARANSRNNLDRAIFSKPIDGPLKKDPTVDPSKETDQISVKGVQAKKTNHPGIYKKTDIFGLRDSKKYQAVMVPPPSGKPTVHRNNLYKVRPEKPPILHPKPIVDYSPPSFCSQDKQIKDSVLPQNEQNKQIIEANDTQSKNETSECVQNKLNKSSQTNGLYDPIIAMPYKSVDNSSRERREAFNNVSYCDDASSIYDNLENLSRQKKQAQPQTSPHYDTIDRLDSPPHHNASSKALPIIPNRTGPHSEATVKAQGADEQIPTHRPNASPLLNPPNYHLPKIEGSTTHKQYLVVNGTSETLLAKPLSTTVKSAPLLQPLAKKPPQGPRNRMNSLPLHSTKDPAILALARKRAFSSTIPPRSGQPFYAEMIQEELPLQRASLQDLANPSRLQPPQSGRLSPSFFNTLQFEPIESLVSSFRDEDKSDSTSIKESTPNEARKVKPEQNQDGALDSFQNKTSSFIPGNGPSRDEDKISVTDYGLEEPKSGESQPRAGVAAEAGRRAPSSSPKPSSAEGSPERPPLANGDVTGLPPAARERWAALKLLRRHHRTLSRSARQLKAASSPEFGRFNGAGGRLAPGRASYPAASLPSVPAAPSVLSRVRQRFALRCGSNATDIAPGTKCESADSGIQILEMLGVAPPDEQVHRLNCHKDGHGGSPCRQAFRHNTGVERQLSTPTYIRRRQATEERGGPLLRRSRGCSRLLRRSVSQPADLDRLVLKFGQLAYGVSDQDCSQDALSSNSEDDLSTDTDSYHSLYTTPTRTLSNGSGEVHFAEALWDHVTLVNEEELAFRAGEVIRVTDCHDKVWWWGSIGPDRSGWFPASFVRVRVHQSDGSTGAVDLSSGEDSNKLVAQSDLVRANVVREILATERDFVQHLQDVIEGYLKQVRKRPDMFSQQRIATIFGNIEQIYDFQSKFLSHLESCCDERHPQNSLIGDCFLRHKDQFEIYSRYCNNHPLAVTELQELYVDSKYLHFFEACRLLQDMIDISLDGFLLTPVQKICKYPLQLAELLKYTPPTHPDHAPVTAALRAMRHVAALVNERKRRAECLERLAEWQGTVDGWEGPGILDTSSMLIHSGEVVRRTAAAWSRDLHLFLFDHVLILCKKDLLKRNHFVYKGRINLDDGGAFAIEDCKDRTGWKVHCAQRDKWYYFYSRSPHERDQWLEAFSRERTRVRLDAEQGFVVNSEAKKAALLAVQNKLKPKRPRAKMTKSSRPPDTAIAELLLDPPSSKAGRSGSLPSSLNPSLVVALASSSTSSSSGKKKGSSSGWFHFGSSKKSKNK